MAETKVGVLMLDYRIGMSVPSVFESCLVPTLPRRGSSHKIHLPMICSSVECRLQSSAWQLMAEGLTNEYTLYPDVATLPRATGCVLRFQVSEGVGCVGDILFFLQPTHDIS